MCSNIECFNSLQRFSLLFSQSLQLKSVWITSDWLREIWSRVISRASASGVIECYQLFFCLSFSIARVSRSSSTLVKMTDRDPLLQPLTWLYKLGGCWWFSDSEHEEWVFPCSMECGTLWENTALWQAFSLSVLSKTFRLIFVTVSPFPVAYLLG